MDDSLKNNQIFIRWETCKANFSAKYKEANKCDSALGFNHQISTNGGSRNFTPFYISNADLTTQKNNKSVKSIVGISPTMVLLFHLLCFYLKM